MALKLFNTMGRELQEFSPIRAGEVGFYGCGPTVYNYAHIGNLRAYVFQDVLDKTLKFLGYSVNHVMNVTDIGHLTGDGDDGEDKMVKSAAERGKSVLEIARFYEDAFFRDCAALNVGRPDTVCRATEHVPEMISLIERLEKNGHTYSAGGNLYYDISTFPDIWRLSGKTAGNSPIRARVDADSNKKNPSDFVLWFTKSKFENQALTWDSPWGRGYPGWHIECSAMSMKYLGEHFDIHTGGVDHIPVHHTNEIAQSEGATGKKWVNFWLHNEFLVVQSDKTGGEKMSKSTGNFLTLQTLLDEGYDALDYRLFLLGAHYRSKIYYSKDAMDGARSARKALLARISRLCEESGGKIAEKIESAQGEKYAAQFKAALEDDLSTPKALGVLQVALKDSEIPPAERLLLAKKLDSVLSLNLLDALSRPESPQNSQDDAKIESLVAERLAAKKAKNWARADEIRAELAKMGISLADGKDGTTWKRI